MYTYQDLLEASSFEYDKMDFIEKVARTRTDDLKTAIDAEEYYNRQNPTIRKFRKVLYDALGNAIPDYFSADYKLTHGFFRRFVTQQVQYVLSNGVTFGKKETKAMLGKDFDNQMQKLAKKAMIDGVAFGFWNLDHLEVFSYANTATDPGFVPLWDEDTGLLRAGVRHWSLPVDGGGFTLRYTLYEEDGYTEYIKRKGEDMALLVGKRPYIVVQKGTEAGGVEATTWMNYPTFPIIPMYANDAHMSEIVGIRSSIDCYDFIKSGMANNVDDASVIYWTLKNSGGMDDVDLTKFIERMKTVKAAVLQADQTAEAHTLTVPVDANERLLDRLRSDMYEDFMLMDTAKALSGNMTATAIRLAYQPQDDKCGDFEYCIRDFISRLLALVGVDDEPSFNWNRIANQTEETQMVMMAANYLDDETLLNHLPWLTPEEVKTVMERNALEAAERATDEPEDEPPTDTTQDEESPQEPLNEDEE